MSGMFSKPKPDAAMQKSQRRQSKSLDDQTADEAREAGSRARISKNRKKSGTLYAPTGGAGVKKETLG